MPDVISVSEFNTAVKSVLQELGLFKIRGEITEFRISPNKGVFITLSDGKSSLSIGGYAPTIKGLDLIEKDMEVVVTGTPDIYVPYGKFSLAAVSVQPFGEGALAIAYSKLKEKLEKEGLFDKAHKKDLPEFVTRIALLTGDKSAAYSDFVKILEEHSSGIEVDFYPVIVQGINSEGDILNKLRKVKSLNYDAIVLTRGGGSLEDLSSFNSEELAREIFGSVIPILVGVGHERDESVADFVADIRASTPSQCAYYLVSRNQEYIDNLENKLSKLAQGIKNKYIEFETTLDNFIFKINSYLLNSVDKLKDKLTQIDRLLDAYDMKSVLKRGFALLQNKTGRVISTKQIEVDEELSVRLYDGELTAIVNNLIKD